MNDHDYLRTYMDDVNFITTGDWDDHLEKSEEILNRLLSLLLLVENMLGKKENAAVSKRDEKLARDTSTKRRLVVSAHFTNSDWLRFASRISCCRGIPTWQCTYLQARFVLTAKGKRREWKKWSFRLLTDCDAIIFRPKLICPLATKLLSTRLRVISRVCCGLFVLLWFRHCQSVFTLRYYSISHPSNNQAKTIRILFISLTDTHYPVNYVTLLLIVVLMCVV